ncbi:MAG: N-acetylglucosamine-6-phosphate deacetylase [Lachnospiraceae bacterium]|nr:N-acetylglucosamine-6-phosphate deacetylase [Lachnospiraceae bacterium]
MIIKNALVYTEQGSFEQMEVLVREGRIAAVEKKGFSDVATGEKVVDGQGMYLIPGLTDIHFHGCVGYDFCDGTEEAIEAIARYEAKNGVTTICPATMTYSEEILAGICDSARSYREKYGEDHTGAALVGINMEGPFISMEKKGAQNPAYIHKPDVEMYRRLQERSGGLIRLVDIAPETEGAMAFIREVHGETVCSLAHTTADYETATEAFENGASHVTHLYNAMQPYTHRKPGLIGAAADTPDCEVELICDGIHIHPAAVRSTFRMFGADRVIMISDSMMATGMEDGMYSLGGQPVKVCGNLATLSDGTIAGSATNLMQCVRVAVKEMGIPLETAIRCAAVNPAKSIGIYDRYGSITAGKAANLVLLDRELTVVKVILNGEEYGG